MKILLIGDYPPPQGGIAIHTKQVHDFLRSQGVEARVLDIGKGGRPAPDVLPVRTPGQLVANVIDHARKGWLVHLHTSGNNPKSFAAAAAVALASSPFSQAVVTLHSGLLPNFMEGATGRRAIARAALGGFRRIVAVSDAIRAALEAIGIPNERIVVHPAFLSSHVRAGGKPNGLEEARRRRSPLLVMAHHPSPVYGRDVAFEALRRLRDRYPDVGLAVFGPGTKSEEFREAAQSFGVTGLLEDFGELEHEQALALIRAGDVFLRPTLADGDSVSVREALVLKTPCVASDVAARPEGVFVFKSKDAKSLEEAVLDAVVRGAPTSIEPDAGPFLLALYREVAAERGGLFGLRLPLRAEGAATH